MGSGGFRVHIEWGGVVGVCWCACFVALNWGGDMSLGWLLGVCGVPAGCSGWVVWGSGVGSCGGCCGARFGCF